VSSHLTATFALSRGEAIISTSVARDLTTIRTLRPGLNSTLLRTVKRAALLWLILFLQMSSPLAQENQEPAFPERLRYVFDLSWCKSWQFACAQCEKDSSGNVVCKNTPCKGKHEFFWCADFAVDKNCTQWGDGCNRCVRDATGFAQCTLRNCFDYRPRFTCLMSNSQRGR
jgi:hypothetical protein